jgi:Integrase core domain
VVRTPLRAPNANAHIERWVGSVRRESRDRLLIFSRRQLERVLRVYVRHYNQQRPHRALDLQAPAPPITLSRRRDPAAAAAPINGATFSADSSTNTKQPQHEVELMHPTRKPASVGRYVVTTPPALCEDRERDPDCD